MIVTVKRFKKQGDNSTLSKVFIDGVFFCYGLEDVARDVKVWGETAIPEGRYRLGLRKLGGMHARYSRLFPNFHEGMMEILNIPNFKYVYIHIGNDIGDTAGCLLVGDAHLYEEEDYELRKSKPAYKRIYQKLIKAVKNGKAEIVIEIESDNKSKGGNDV